MATHLVIPDTQVQPGQPYDQLAWVGQYIVDQFAGKPDVTIIHLGDHWNMSSLSSYDRGKKKMEGARYEKDIEVGNDAFVLLDAPIKRRRKWRPRKIYIPGNHCWGRVLRAQEDNAQLEGAVSIDHMDTQGWERPGYLEVVNVDGIAYSHFFYNPMTGKPYGGMIETRIKNIGTSFTMGHQQQFKYGEVPFAGGRRIGMIAGNCYLHDEEYLGPQGNQEWRGMIVCHEVEGGQYDLMKVSLGYLCKRYEGVSLAKFMQGHKPSRYTSNT